VWPSPPSASSTRSANLGLWPSRLRRLGRARAERIVAEVEREESLTLLVENTTEILAQLEPNGGKSMRDAVNRLQEGQENSQRLVEQPAVVPSLRYSSAEPVATRTS
jgi:hypothetical protein